MAYEPSIWKTMRRQPITLLSATYDTDGQLYQNVISGPKPALSCLPEEGLYILCQNRGLQIASACDLRKCYITQVCHCAVTAAAANARTKQQTTQPLARGYDKCCAPSWLNFYRAAEAIRSLKLCFLAHPRTLSWDNVFGMHAFHFDSELEEHYSSTYSYKCPTSTPRAVGTSSKNCPGDMIDLIGDAWREFLEYGDYDFKPVVTLPEKTVDDDYDGEGTEGGGNRTGDRDLDISEWDDVDVPIHVPSTAVPVQSKKRPRPEDDFDLIDDLIEDEFPHLKRTLREPQRVKDSSKEQHHNPQRKSATTHKTNKRAKTNNTNTSTKANNYGDLMATALVSHEEPPAPVIIPPKNMFVGRGLTPCSFEAQLGSGRYGDSRVAADRWISIPC
ncbi:hypothetical protein F5Y10DRAFT_290827 [Nemania abortiva]|nr:hypothetical protein F5Y10DRAFT_290827 [Nemania abortiva]